jgi:uncharacterized membrane protein
MLTSSFLLTASFLFHLIATVVWIGGLVTISFVIEPIVNRVLTNRAEAVRVLDAAHLMDAVQKRFQPLANLSLIVLLLTGMVQLVNNRFYKGLLQMDNVWSTAILLKHLAVAVMIGLAAYVTFSVQPALRHNALLVANGVENPIEAARLQVQQTRLTRLNLGLMILVLVFTALASAQ